MWGGGMKGLYEDILYYKNVLWGKFMIEILGNLLKIISEIAVITFTPPLYTWDISKQNRYKSVSIHGRDVH